MNERDLLDGEIAVYPGHPLTLAYLIVNAYPSLAQATRKSDRSEFMHALANCGIPGAGGNVYSALRFLKAVADGELSMQQAVDRANDNWAHCDDQAQTYIERWRQGQAQADRILDRLTKQLIHWSVAS